MLSWVPGSLFKRPGRTIRFNRRLTRVRIDELRHADDLGRTVLQRRFTHSARTGDAGLDHPCLLYTSPSPRDS